MSWMRRIIVLGAAVQCSASAGCEPLPTDASQSAVEQAANVIDRPRSPGEDNGLEVVRWSVHDSEPAIRRALARYAVRDVPLGASIDALERHGFRAVVVPDERLANVLADLGGTTRSVAVWHGQVIEWREVTRLVSESPRVAMIDGRAEQLPAGWLRLMVRAWTVPLEEGAALEVQLAPQLLSDAQDLTGLVNRDQLRGRLWSAAAIHVELPRDTCLLLVSAPPRPFEVEEDPEGPRGGYAADARTGTGPLVELPSTLGELLLTDRDAVPPRRAVLVLRAKLPDILFPDPVTPLEPDPERPLVERPAEIFMRARS